MPTRVLGSAWPQHFNKVGRRRRRGRTSRRSVCRSGARRIRRSHARCRRSSAATEQGLPTKLAEQLQGPVTDNRGGGSDDIGDISWNVPTVTLRFPSNIPGLPGHNWANAIAMATPIAHKGATAGAKVQAMTMIDLLTKPALVRAGVGLLPQRADEVDEVRAADPARGQAGDRAEPRDHGDATGRRCGSTTSIRRATRRTSSSSASVSDGAKKLIPYR